MLCTTRASLDKPPSALIIDLEVNSARTGPRADGRNISGHRARRPSSLDPPDLEPSSSQRPEPERPDRRARAAAHSDDRSPPTAHWRRAGSSSRQAALPPASANRTAARTIPALTVSAATDTALANTGPADAAPADTGLADTGLADTGLADTGLAN